MVYAIFRWILYYNIYQLNTLVFGLPFMHLLLGSQVKMFIIHRFSMNYNNIFNIDALIYIIGILVYMYEVLYKYMIIYLPMIHMYIFDHWKWTCPFTTICIYREFAHEVCLFSLCSMYEYFGWLVMWNGRWQ